MSRKQQLQNKPEIVSDCYVGIEVEVEFSTSDVDIPELSFWDVKPDGSLRYYGVEFCSNKISGSEVVKAIHELDTAFSTPLLKAYRRRSSRAGMHIHVDLSGMTDRQILRFLALGAMYESALYTIAGRSRSNSIFCIPLAYTNAVIPNIKRQVRFYTNKNPELYASDYIYTSMCIGKWDKYPTIEFRLFPTWISGNDTLDKVNLLLSLKSAAEFITDSEIVECYTNESLAKLTTAVFRRMPNRAKYFSTLSTFNSECYSTAVDLLEA